MDWSSLSRADSYFSIFYKVSCGKGVTAYDIIAIAKQDIIRFVTS